MADLKEAAANLDIAEAYGLAIKAEEDGFALYQKAIEMTDNPRAREDLGFLRDQEKGHKAYFEKLLKETGREYKADSGSALGQWVRENLFGPAEEALGKSAPKTYKQSLSMGISIEENSIRFYKELKKAAPAENRKVLGTIIREEKRHRKFLGAILKYSDLA